MKTAVFAFVVVALFGWVMAKAPTATPPATPSPVIERPTYTLTILRMRAGDVMSTQSAVLGFSCLDSGECFLLARQE